MKKRQKLFRQKQAVMELAIFGAVFLFVLGSLVNKSMTISYQQNAQIKAMRIALAMSYYYSHEVTSASRNNASVIFIEDRLSAGAGKYGSFDRVPIIASGAGTLSRNLYMPVDFGDWGDIGRVDVFINGKHLVLTNADFTTIKVEGAVAMGTSATPVYFYKQVMNHPDIGQIPNIDGLIHPAAAAAGETGADGSVVGVNCMAGKAIFGDFGNPAFGNCLWGWQAVSSESIDIHGSKNTVLDVDGDLQDETILGVKTEIKSTGNIINTNETEDTVTDDEGEYSVVKLDILDYQRGQINMSKPAHKGLPQGLTNDFSMSSIQKGSITIDGGYYPPSKSGTVDIITRHIRLNPQRNKKHDKKIGCTKIIGDICYVETVLSTP